MGPAAPAQPAAPTATAAARRPSRSRSRVAAGRPYSGGPTKDHILESGGNGIALLDYDGDGRLDVYVVTGAELSPARQRIAHRNALFRNLGAGASRTCRRRPASTRPPGAMALRGRCRRRRRLDLYVTNWGSNALFRNKGDGTFEDIAAQAGVAAGGWSTGCTFFDADTDGDLDCTSRDT